MQAVATPLRGHRERIQAGGTDNLSPKRGAQHPFQAQACPPPPHKKQKPLSTAHPRAPISRRLPPEFA